MTPVCRRQQRERVTNDDVTADAVRCSVTTLTTYRWTTESTLTGSFRC